MQTAAAPKIVFACKSNTCRSQMAEGWARDWIRRRTEQGRSFSCSPTVASAALASSSIYEESKVGSGGGDGGCAQCCDMLCETRLQRKIVKEKAVETMRGHGIDISQHHPKALEEIMSASLLGPGQESVEKLVILCSCGADVKKEVISRAKSVEEWNVDAPTAAEKSGEVDAFRRVSLEIKREVTDLMERMFGTGEESKGALFANDGMQAIGECDNNVLIDESCVRKEACRRTEDDLMEKKLGL